MKWYKLTFSVFHSFFLFTVFIFSISGIGPPYVLGFFGNNVTLQGQ